MDKKLKVLISGTGFAGQGHADAFRAYGVEVVGIVGRTASVVSEVAKKMNIPYFGTDWQKALTACKPDIVSIATPGGAHHETISQAIEFGCHVFSDKPLSDTSESAIELFELSKKANIKTAFASSFRYMPHIIHAKQLIANNFIGEPVEMESISHFNLERDIPFGWSHRKEDGGGRLNNNFTHMISIATSVLGEKVLSISGEVRDDLGKAPIVDGIHNFKTRREHIPEDLNDPTLKWGESNVEWSYKVIQRNLREAAAAAVEFFASRKIRRLFLGGTLETIGKFRDLLPKQMQSCLAGQFQIDNDAGEHEVRQKSLALLQEANAVRETTLVRRLVEEASPGGSVVTGLEETLPMIFSGRVQTLIVSDGFRHKGYRYADTGYLSTKLVIDQPEAAGEPVEVEDVVEEAVSQALSNGGHVELISDNADLDQIGRIGAILRYESPMTK